MDQDKAKQVFQAELDRQNAPDKKCPKCNTQIVKIGSLCPFCGVKVEA